jgi:hypothetical protein
MDLLFEHDRRHRTGEQIIIRSEVCDWMNCAICSSGASPSEDQHGGYFVFRVSDLGSAASYRRVVTTLSTIASYHSAHFYCLSHTCPLWKGRGFVVELLDSGVKTFPFLESENRYLDYSYFDAGGGVTTAVSFRIAPSDLLKT